MFGVTWNFPTYHRHANKKFNTQSLWGLQCEFFSSALKLATKTWVQFSNAVFIRIGSSQVFQFYFDSSRFILIFINMSVELLKSFWGVATAWGWSYVKGLKGCGRSVMEWLNFILITFRLLKEKYFIS